MKIVLGEVVFFSSEYHVMLGHKKFKILFVSQIGTLRKTAMHD